MSAESENILIITADRFRADFPEFTDETKHTESAIVNVLHRASSFVSRWNSGALKDEKRILAIELMAAHLKFLQDGAIVGNTGGGLIGSSSVGSVSVTMIPPLVKRQFDYWMNQTMYGQQYLALLGSLAPAGLFFGGSFQRVFR